MKTTPIIIGAVGAVAASAILTGVLIANAGSPADKVGDAIEKSIVNVITKSEAVSFTEGLVNGGSIEISGNLEDIMRQFVGMGLDIGGNVKAYLNLADYEMAMEASISMDGSEVVDGAAYISRDAAAVKSETLLGDKAYGIDIKNLLKNFDDSEFGDGGEFELGIDADELEEYFKMLDTANSDLQKDTMNLAKELKNILVKSVEKSAEIEKGSNSMKIGSKTVKTNEIVITLEDEALARFVEEVLTRFRDSKKVENYFNEYAESLSSMEGLAEVGDIEDLYDEMIDAIDELLDEIDELEEEVDGVEITITANIAKSGGELVGLEAEVRGNGGKVSMEAVCGPTWSNIEELSVSVDAGYDSLDFEYIVDVNDKKEFAAELSLDVSGYTMLEGEVNWDKKGGDFEIFANADGVTASLEAVVKKDGKALIIEPDSISADGQRISLDGIVITLKSSDKLPAIKKFDDILKMDADALEDLVLEAMDAAEELSGLLY